MDFSPALFKELRSALEVRGKKKRPAITARIRSTIAGGITTASQQTSALLTGKRKAIELTSSGDFSEYAIRRPVTSAGSAPPQVQ
jgi:hypothetical protein